MKTFARNFDGLKLNQKFTLAIFGMVLIPVVVLAIVLFSNTHRMITEDKINDIETSLYQNQFNIEKTVDLCNMTTQVFLNNTNLINFLIEIKKDTVFSTEELLDFYRNDIAILEKLLHANPYLYQVRVFYDNENIPEMMPVLYHTSRMEKLQWAGGDWESNTWQYDYPDVIYPAEVTKPAQHIMSLVTAIHDFDYGLIGVLEVSVRMDEAMPGLFTADQESYSAFIADNGNWYYDERNAPFWLINKETVAACLPETLWKVHTQRIQINGSQSWMTIVPLAQIGGCYVVVTPATVVSGRLSQFGKWYTLGIAAALSLLALAVNLIVKAMLRRFYIIFETITTIQNGNLSVSVPEIGNDEIGLLAKQMNIMMERIVKLMDDNVKREILAKNSEIRALQSQINAHFIYNVLESIKMMAEMDEEYEIADAIQSLGALLRYSMKWNSPYASLADEIENVKNYLALINLRFDYHVTLRKTLPFYLLHCQMPKMTLQPIVENAVVHGIEGIAADSIIDISAEEGDEAILIHIMDYGKGMDHSKLEEVRKRLDGEPDQDPGKSIGLKNVHDRIKTAYGPDYGLQIKSEQDHFTCITIKMPLLKEKVSPGENCTDR